MADAAFDLDVVRQSSAAANAAAERARISIAELDDMRRLEDASTLFSQVWSATPEDPIMSASIMRALSHAGNYVAGAYLQGRLIGAIVGFLGRHDGEVQLHSHILGVLEEARGRNVGFALKQHQRAWALGRGITTMSWTFDPLVRRNAYFNLTKLGARVIEYHENFYGAMADGINNDDQSDRVVARWQLDSPEAVAGSERRAIHPDATTLADDDRARLLAPETLLVSDAHGAPQTREADGTLLLAWIPEDVVEMRGTNPELARRWRLALRSTVGEAIADGYVATALTRGGWLVLRRR